MAYDKKFVVYYVISINYFEIISPFSFCDLLVLDHLRFIYNGLLGTLAVDGWAVKSLLGMTSRSSSLSIGIESVKQCRPYDGRSRVASHPYIQFGAAHAWWRHGPRHHRLGSRPWCAVTSLWQSRGVALAWLTSVYHFGRRTRDDVIHRVSSW